MSHQSGATVADAGDISLVHIAGGGALDDFGECPPGGPEPIVAGDVHHFLVLEQGDCLTATVIDVTGRTIDQLDLALP